MNCTPLEWRPDVGEHISRHHFRETIVTLGVILRSRLGLGGRSVVEVMKAINEVFDNPFDKIPCANTIGNWSLKCGLDTLEENAGSLSDTDYCLIIDESMMIGSNKLALVIAAPAEHGGAPLRHGNVFTIGIATAESFDSKKIDALIKSVSEKVGHPPKYVITDNASIMKKGVSMAGVSHHCDISHSLGMLLERAYKNEQDFIQYTKLLADAQFKNNMKQVAYIMPPKQRTIARFINLAKWVDWSSRIMNVYHILGQEEKKALDFVRSNSSLVDELSEVMACVGFIEKECKNNGLSKETVRKSLKHIRTTIMMGSERMRELAKEVERYLQKEVEWMNDGDVHHNSSDIIESTFGILKARKSPNKLYGVTPLVLHIPLYQAIADKEGAQSYDFKKHLENKKMKDIQKWRKENLPENLVGKRIRILNLQNAS